jgi:hypothetical protein
VTEAEDAQEFERRFRERAAEYLIGDKLHIDFRRDREYRAPSAYWGWFLVEEITLRGSFPHTELLVLGTSTQHPSCRFGFALPIWFEEGRASWDPSTGWKPKWAEDAATMLCYNTFEEAWWTVGLPRQIVCNPDDDGVTWLKLTMG